MKKKEERKRTLYFLLLILSLLLIGCTPNPIIIERNITINRTINHTIYITNTTIVPCNVTEPEINITIYDRNYVLSLIRQLKHYEKQQDRYINNSNCFDDINRTTNDLEECENALCQWNSTWC